MENYLELKKKIEELKTKAEEARKAEVDDVVKKIRSLMTDYMISIEEIQGEIDKPSKKPKSKAKYRDPVTKKEWSGRGATPGWLKNKNRNDFLIEE